MDIDRRTWLATAASAACATLALPRESSAADKPRLPRIAAINSIYRARSHAYHIAGRFIYGYDRDGVKHQPPFQLARMFNHQAGSSDLGAAICKQHGIELCTTVESALEGPDGLDVDGVLLIVEHGDYPLNARGQIEYPRYEFFERITNVFRKAGRAVPIFCDKHLSYEYEQAAKMVRVSEELKFGLMAGSSLPVTWRVPELMPARETPFREGLVCFGFANGPAEVYLFHALETLQCMLERRTGGETGVKQVVALRGDDVWRAGYEGRWSWSLLEHALKLNPSRNYGQVRDQVRDPLALLIEYQDGTRGTVLNLIEGVTDLSFAGRVEGQVDPVGAWFVLPAPPGARFFDPLTWNIEQLFTTGKSPYPIERTLLTSTVLDFGLRSLQNKQPQAHDALQIRYQPPADDGHFRGSFITG